MSKQTSPENGMRINRFLARAGLGSRRAVEEIVSSGRVKINGEKVTDLGRRIDVTEDTVLVDDRPVIIPDDYRIYVFHKPLGVVSTLKSQGGQSSLLPYRLQADLPDRYVPVGRLDAETTGLLLWTDDGELNQDLCRPSSGIWKKYEVELNEPPTRVAIKKLTSGEIRLDGRPCRPCKLEMNNDLTTRHWNMELHEGRKRQIRRMFAAVDLKVINLHRQAIGTIQLGLLRPGDFRRLSKEEELELRQQVADQKNRGSKK